MSNDELFAQLEAKAAEHKVKVVEGAFGSIELEAPEGMRWDADLHVLVTAPWDNDTRRSIIRGAIKDLKNNVQFLHKCPDDCACKETEQ